METQTLEAIDLSEKLKPHEDKWVALSLDHRDVLGVGDNLEEAKQQAEKKRKKYVFLKLPPFNVNYVLSSWL